ncbi:MAG TPA: M20/M25/M40 family metallo-hydrolase [Ktedonobacterales bacterium]|nr:M20/M25/M40 family metallo-hydrolase [Ktedonobacterales bacterium]
MPDDYTAYLEAHPNEARELLERLCSQPSVAAQHLGMPEMADLIESLLRETGFRTERLAIPDAPPIIYGELRGGGAYTLLLYNHYDVQPPEPFELWESPPFEPTERDGKLYARGISDNKGEIAARLAAIRALRASGEPLPITLRWIIEGEEEVGSPHFEAIVAPHADKLRADACFWEGAGFNPFDQPDIGLGSKGLLYVQLDVSLLGKDAHSGAAAILPSAAWRLTQALATLKAPDGTITIPGFYDDVRPPTAAQLEVIRSHPPMDDVLRQSYQVARFLGDATGHAIFERSTFSPTCNIAGLLSGYTGEGTKTVLPAAAMAKIDFRLVPDQDPDDILAKLRAHLDANGYDDISLTTFSNAEPVVTPLDDPLVAKVSAIAARYNGKSPSVTLISGGTLPLLAGLRRVVGVPGLSAPGNAAYWASGAHSPNEHIRLSDLDRAVCFNCHMFTQLGN